MAGKKRFIGPPPRLLGRGVSQYLTELSDFLTKLWQSLAVIVTQGFQEVDPEDVNITTSPGTETLGWAAADHEHRLGIVSEAGDLITHDGTDPTALGIDGTGGGEVLTIDPVSPVGMSWQVPGAAAVSIFDGCVSAWKLDEATGLRLDSIGRDGFNDLDETNGVAQAAGKLGSSALFVAANSEFLSILDANQQGLNPGVSDFAFSLWFYPIGTTGAGDYWVLSKGTGGGGADVEGYSVLLRGTTAGGGSASRLRVEFGDGTAAITGCQFHSTDLYTLNAWNHLFVYFDRNDKVHVYLDGVKQAPSTGSSDDMDAFDHTDQDCSPAAAFALGCLSRNGGATQNFHDGRLDAVQVFSFPGTISNIPAMAAALYNGGNGRELAPLWSERDDDALAYAMM